MSFLSQNLTWEEVLFNSGYEAGECPKAVLGEMFLHAQRSWQPVRTAWGRSLFVIPSGGIRSPAQNKKVGGAAKSQHVVGCATDVRISLMQPNADFLRLYDMVDRMQRDGDIPRGGLAMYFNFELQQIRFLHWDSRGYLARWNAKHLKAARAHYASL